MPGMAFKLQISPAGRDLNGCTAAEAPQIKTARGKVLYGIFKSNFR